MRFVMLLGMLLISGRIMPFPSQFIEDMMFLLIVMAGFDLIDFIMNIIRTFKCKSKCYE